MASMRGNGQRLARSADQPLERDPHRDIGRRPPLGASTRGANPQVSGFCAVLEPDKRHSGLQLVYQPARVGAVLRARLACPAMETELAHDVESRMLPDEKLEHVAYLSSGLFLGRHQAGH